MAKVEHLWDSSFPWSAPFVVTKIGTTGRLHSWWIMCLLGIRMCVMCLTPSTWKAWNGSWDDAMLSSAYPVHGPVSEWSKSLGCWRASRLLSWLFVFHPFVEQLINQWAALSNKIITTDMTVFCWGPVLLVYSSIGLERQSTFQSVLYYSWKTKPCFCSSWHGSQSASILITLLSSMWRTLTTGNFDHQMAGSNSCHGG